MFSKPTTVPMSDFYLFSTVTNEKWVFMLLKHVNSFKTKQIGSDVHYLADCINAKNCYY